jgi:hypothetical protein
MKIQAFFLKLLNFMLRFHNTLHSRQAMNILTKTSPSKTILGLFLLIPVLTLHFIETFAQRKGDINYSIVEFGVQGENGTAVQTDNPWFFGSSFNYAVWEFSNIAKDYLANKKEMQRMEMQRQQSISKLGMIKNQYAEYTAFPATIIDGWHSAIATDNLNFCKDVKVLVKDNRITKFVVDNYVPLNFMVTRDIRNGKNIVSLKDFNGNDLSIAEIYFIYDLDEQRLVEPPVEPGYICFWTDMKSYADIKLTFNGSLMETFTVSYPAEPNCFSNGMVCRIVKPGSYSYKALGKGTIDWQGTLEIKADQCVRVRLGR